MKQIIPLPIHDDEEPSNLGAVATKNKGPWHLFLVEIYEAEADAKKRESGIIKSFESGVFLEQTYWSRAAIQEKCGMEHTDWDAKIVNNRRNEKANDECIDKKP